LDRQITATRSRGLLFAAAVAAGAATWWLILGLGFLVLRAIWHDYAAAEPQKAYTLGMLGARLLIFSLTIGATSAVAGLIARDERLAWFAGFLILAFSVPSHLYPGYVWDDYPAWYHILYLASILPIAWVSGRATRDVPQRGAPGPAA